MQQTSGATGGGAAGSTAATEATRTEGTAGTAGGRLWLGVVLLLGARGTRGLVQHPGCWADQQLSC